MTKSPLVSDLIFLGYFVASRKWIIFQNQCFAACDALFKQVLFDGLTPLMEVSGERRQRQAPGTWGELWQRLTKR